MVDANGLRFHVRDEGSGTPVILLHGFPDTGDLWRHQVPALVGGGFRAIVPDMRGRGRSSRPAAVEDYRLSAIVRDVTGILDALEVGRAHVVGHDWGAVVAWLVAALAPERVDRLVAISVGAPGAVSKPTLEQLQRGWYRILFLFEGIAEELVQRDDWYLLRELLQGAADLEASRECKGFDRFGDQCARRRAVIRTALDSDRRRHSECTLRADVQNTRTYRLWLVVD